MKKNIDDKFIQQLSTEEKRWIAHAIAGIIGADGQVTNEEMLHLRHAIGFLENVQEIETLVQVVKERKIPKLQSLKTVNRKIATKLMFYLGSIVVSDDKLSRSEAEFFKYVGSKLGFDLRYSHDVLQWYHDWLNLEKKQKSLLTAIAGTAPVYKR